MLNKIDHKEMGSKDIGWLRSIFHFSFSNYYNPENIDFGVLRVLNDDIVQPHQGFGMHPHDNMEIISYVIEGTLTHGDSMKNKHELTRGHVQYMSAGTGVQHSEHNQHDDPLRLLQLWIYPDKKGYEPTYGDFKFDWSRRVNQWFHMVSSQNGDAPINIHQDANIYVGAFDQGQEINFEIQKGRQGYCVQIEGSSTINDITLNERDALEIVEESLTIETLEKSHFIIIEMPKQEV
jgi:redox-sensitive bicupin YhaK (pirin superfamily)